MEEVKKDSANVGEDQNRNDSGKPARFSFLSRNRSSSDKSLSGTSNRSSDSNGKSGTASDGSGGGSGGETRGNGETAKPDSGDGTGRVETDSGKTDGSGNPDYTGRKGRHPNDCICERCRNRRAGTVETGGDSASDSAYSKPRTRRISSEAVPQSVDWSDVFPGMTDGKMPQVSDILSFGYSTLFELVKYARREEHWALSKQEAAKLGKVTLHCVNTLDDGMKAKIVKRFEKQLPWLSLLGFGVVITAPRVVASMAIEKMKQDQRFGPPIPFIKREKEDASAPTNAPEPASEPSASHVESPFAPGINPAFPSLDYVVPG